MNVVKKKRMLFQNKHAASNQCQFLKEERMNDIEVLLVRRNSSNKLPQTPRFLIKKLELKKSILMVDIPNFQIFTFTLNMADEFTINFNVHG